MALLIAIIAAACTTASPVKKGASDGTQQEVLSAKTYEELLQDPRYIEVGDLVVFEGDIVLGTIDEVKAGFGDQRLGSAVNGALGASLASVGHFDRSSRFDVPERTWGNKIKYVFDSQVSEETRDVIRNDVIPRFTQRTSLLFEESAAIPAGESVISFLNATFPCLCGYYPQTTNGVVIHQIELSGCAAVICTDSPGDEEAPTTGEGTCSGDCDTEPYVQVLHELGHALGLGHEHQRPDRDTYVQDPNYDPNGTHTEPEDYETFAPTTVRMFGDYDVTSIMQIPNLTNLANNTDIPVNKELSDYDVRALQVMYGSQYQSTASVVSWGANRLDVFYRAANGSVGHQAWNGNWSTSNLAGTILGAPEAVSHAPNKLHVFIRDTNRKLRVKEFNTTWSTSWANLGNEKLASDPTAVSWGQNHIAIFAKHDDGTVRVKTWNGSSYGAWVNLGGISKGPVEAVSWASGRLDVFTVGSQGALYHKWFKDGAWSGNTDGPWEWLGGNVVGKPTAVSWGPNRIDLFVKGTGNGLHHRYWNGGPDWLPANPDGSWESMGGSIIGHPVAESWGSQRIDLFWQASNGELRTKVYDSGWLDSTALTGSGRLLGAPEVVSWGVNRLDVFGRDGNSFGTNGSSDLLHKYWNGNWSPSNAMSSRSAQVTW